MQPNILEILSHQGQWCYCCIAQSSSTCCKIFPTTRKPWVVWGTQEGAMNFEGSDGWVASWLLPWELWIRCMNWFSHITLSYFITHPISDISHVTCESYYLGLASIGIGCNHLIFFCSWSGQCRVTGNFTALPACRETLGLIWISQCYFRGPSQSQHFPGRWHIIMTMMEAIDALARELYGHGNIGPEHGVRLWSIWQSDIPSGAKSHRSTEAYWRHNTCKNRCAVFLLGVILGANRKPWVSDSKTQAAEGFCPEMLPKPNFQARVPRYMCLWHVKDLSIGRVCRMWSLYWTCLAKGRMAIWSNEVRSRGELKKQRHFEG